MSSLINSLKSEIARVSRKELKDELQSLRKATTAHRSEIAGLKRQIKALASEIKSSRRATGRPAVNLPAENSKPATLKPLNAERFAALRARLGITQVQMSVLLQASPLSVHKWESGVVQPRAAQAAKIAEIMKLGKREALGRLQS